MGIPRWLITITVAWAGFLLLYAIWNRLELDFVIADWLFSLEGGKWSLRQNFITSTVLHEGGGAISRLAGIAALVWAARVWRGGASPAEVRAAAYLLASLALSVATVSFLKGHIAMDCPWALTRYGGETPYFGLFEARPAGAGQPGCFPAGHASAGYAWIALYFYFLAVKPKFRWIGLGVGLGSGLIFGIGQQLRGAHFVSHDLWTVMICWTWAWLLNQWILKSDLLAAALAHPRTRRVRKFLLSRPAISTEGLLLTVLIGLVVMDNPVLWRTMLDDASSNPWTVLGVIGATAGSLVCLHFLVLQCLLTRRTAKLLASILILCAAAASYFSETFGIIIDGAMMTNVLQTDSAEARDLISGAFARHMLVFGLLPTFLVFRVQVVSRPWREALTHRALYVSIALFAALTCGWASYPELAPLMRTSPHLRHHITPGNVVVGMFHALESANAGAAPSERIPVGSDAQIADNPRERPRLLVLVVGETVRAANWGLSGYQRQTTPHLAARNVINFDDVSSCGTSTAVSLPCMFSPTGDHDRYRESQARRSETLLDVLSHAGVRVLWIDNQSGCKGVCSGVETLALPGCDGGHCLDEQLVAALKSGLDPELGDTVIVLHQMGNHGPAYFERYPESSAIFQPACQTVDLRRCTHEQLMNAYDNAIAYTDAFLDQTIGYLDQQDVFDASLLYVSDHGESLGEFGMYLHGMPYAIAPDFQTQIPMALWMSDRFAQNATLDRACIERHSHAQALSHAFVFHSVLGLMRVSTAARDENYDFTYGCVT